MMRENKEDLPKQLLVVQNYRYAFFFVVGLHLDSGVIYIIVRIPLDFCLVSGNIPS